MNAEHATLVALAEMFVMQLKGRSAFQAQFSVLRRLQTADIYLCLDQMTNRLDVGKVVYGAFLVPWLHRRAFARALALPLAAMTSLALCSYYLIGHVPKSVHWLLYGAYWLVFVLFAVNCHRLVLLDPSEISRQWLPQWSMRQTRFLVWFVLVWGFCFLVAAWPVMTVLGTLILNIPGPWRGSGVEDGWRWVVQAGQVVSFYLMARLSVIFPATALDRKVNVRWAWQRTRQNGWRLTLVVAALPWLLSHMVDFVYRGDATTLEAIALTFLGTALFAVEISAVSLAYRELTKDEEPAQMSGSQ